MEYVSLYRKWRPGSFAEVRGQEPIIQTLTNALEQGRIAHAYLFAGPRGTGKTSTAKVLAKCLNCAVGISPFPCGQCESCKKIKNGYAIDVMEIDAASNRGIDEIRDLREKIKFLPSEGRYKVYIIDEVHMLTTEAFNALLKTLEEPPKHVVFILATTELHKIPATILSRCQCFDFKPIPLKEIIDSLAQTADKEGLEITEIALSLIARNAQGGLRDALSLLDQVAAFAGQKINEHNVADILGLTDQESLWNLAELLIKKDSAGMMKFVQYLIDEGKDLQQFVKGAQGYWRNLLLFKVVSQPEELLDLSSEEIARLKSQALKFRKKDLLRTLELLVACENEMKWSSQARWSLELVLLKLIEDEDDEIAQLRKRLEKLENLLTQGLPAEIKLKDEAEIKDEVSINKKVDVPAEIQAKDEGETSLTLEDIQEGWPVVLEKVKKHKRTFHAYLLEGKVEGLDGKKIILSFQKKFIFHKENAEKPEVKQLVEDILEQTFQEKLNLKCILEESKTQEREKLELKPGKEEKALAAQDDPLVKKALEIFGGEIIEIKEEG